MDGIINDTIADSCNCATCYKIPILRIGSRNVKNIKRAKRVITKIKSDIELNKLIK